MADGRTIIKPDPPEKRPQTLANARRLIEKIFKEQPFGGWNETEQAVYLATLSIFCTVGQLTIEQARRVVKDLEDARMILFHN